MPRNVTLTFDDGSSHVYNGVPDDATPEMVMQRASQEFAGKSIVNIDGGKGGAKSYTTDMLPGPLGEMQPVVENPPAPEPTLAEKAVGAGEAGLAAVTGATGGMAGYVGGVGEGLVESVSSGKFGTQEGANLVKERAVERASQLTYSPRTETGQAYAENIATAGEAITPILPMMAEINAVTTAMRSPGALNDASQAISKAWNTQSKTKQAIADTIAKDPYNSDVVKYMVNGAGKVVNDPLAKEAIRQGFNDGVVAVAKGASPSDRVGMKRMVEILKSGRKNAMYSVDNRPTDVAGNALVKTINHVSRVNKRAGQSIDKVAQRLKGKQVDYSSAMDSFMTDLQSKGVTVKPSEGKIKVSFKGSDFEGSTGAEILIKRIVNRLSSGKKPDAYDLHRMKRFIDEQVSYGKQKEGLTGGAERLVKGLRRGLDSVLDENFDAYKRANDTYSQTRTAIDNIQKAAGSSIDLSGANANKALGTVLRRQLSNAQSRVKLIDSIDEIQKVAKATGGANSSNIKALILFADELDTRFGAAARTSLKGQMEQATKTGADIARGRGATEIVVDAAGKAIEKARGVNDEAAIAAIEKLLSRGDK